MANEFKVRKGLIVNGSGSTILDIQGSQGQLFSVTDQLSGSLFSVNDISGVPILEAFSDTTVKMGQYLAEAIIVSGSNARITGSLFGTSSWAVSASSAVSALSSSFATTSSFAVSASRAVTSSYALNADLLDGRDSTVFATTGSNVFRGDQTVTGSLFTSGSNTLVGNTTLTGSLNVTGSTFQVGNNTLAGNTLLSGSIVISGSLGSTPTVRIFGDTQHNGYIRFDPVTTNINQSISASYIYVSGSTNDLYFSQNVKGYSNTTRLRWIEGNLYTGLLHGGIITSQSSTVYQVSSGSGIIVDLNGSFNDDPYPTIQYLEWSNLSASISDFTASYQQLFVGVNSTGSLTAQGTPFNNGQFDTLIPVGDVFFQNGSTINGFKTAPSLAYGWKQRSNVFVQAFGPLKLSGLTLSVSGSSTGSLIVGSGTAFADGQNYTVDPNNPSYITDQGTNVSKIFRYYQSGSSWVYNTNAGAGFGSIDPANYSNNGILTSVGAGNWSIQRVFWFPNSVTKAIVVYYGNQIYSTEAEAIANLSFETFVEAPNTAANAVYIGAIVISGNGVFTNTNTFSILPAGLFRNIGGSGGGGSIVTQTLAGLSDVSISGPTDKQPLAYDTTLNKWTNQSNISASISGNAATATSASYAVTSSQAISASYASSSTSASYAFNATSASYAFNALTASHALTASSADNFVVRQNVTASNILATGTVTAQTLLVQTVSSSVVYSSGSNVFGNNLNNTQVFTGSVNITGSLTVNGTVNNLTGSLFGTASWAQNAVSSSFSSNSATASFVPSSSLTGSFFAQGGNSFGTQALLGTNDSQSLAFETSGSIRMFISGSGNVGIGTTSPSARLHVAGSSRLSGAVTIIGSGNTSATTALTIQNTSAFGLAAFRDDGFVTLGAGNWLGVGEGQRYLYRSLDTTGVFSIGSDSTVTTRIDLYATSHATRPSTIEIVNSFEPTSGTTVHTMLGVTGTINQTGGANGITRGIRINPSLTSAADWRSLEFNNNSGWGIFGSGSAPNYLSGSLSIGTRSTGSFTLDVSGSGRYTNGLQVTGSTNLSGNLNANVTTAVISSGFSSGQYPLSLFDGVYNFNFGFYASGVGSNRLSIYRNSSQTYFDNSAGNFYFNAPVYSSLFTGSFTGSLFGTASWASNAVTASNALTASYVLNAVSASFAATASSADNFVVRQSLTASSALINGTITAQTLVVSTVSSSVVYSSGSNIFGNSTANTQTFTGSVNITGSFNLIGNADNTGISSFRHVTGYNSTTTDGAIVIYNGASSMAMGVTSDSYLRIKGPRVGFITNLDGTQGWIQGAYIYSFNSNPGLRLGTSVATTTTANNNSIYVSDSVTVTNAIHSYNMLRLYSTVSSSVANGLTRGVYISPSIIGTTEFRAVQWDNNTSWGLYGSGSAANYLSGSLSIGTSNTGSFTLDVSGSGRFTSDVQITGSLNVPIITGSLFGTSSWAQNAVTSSYILNAVSASFASTASFVNRLNQNVIITGSLTVGSGSVGVGENTLVLGPSPAGGIGEGGQILLSAPGGTYTSASMWDNYQNSTRLLRGTNAGSDAVIAQFNMHTKQVQLPAYNSTTAFTGTTLVGIIGFDANGNLLTTTTSSAALSGGATNYIARWASSATLTTGSLWDNGTNVGVGNQSPSYKLDVSGDIRATGAVYANANGAMYFRGGDDAELWDINVANTVGVYGQQDQTVGSIKLGSGGGTLSGYSSSIGIGVLNPTLGTLQVNGNVYANSFTGSLFGTASWARNAATASAVFGGTQFAVPFFNTSTSLSSSFLQQTSSIMKTTFAGQDYGLNLNFGVNEYTLGSGSNNIKAAAFDDGVYVQAANAIDLFTVGTNKPAFRLNDQTKLIYSQYGAISSVYGLRIDFGNDRYQLGDFRSPSSGSITVTNEKVDISKSTFVTGSVTATNFTGSLFGTSSWAQNAVTSSFVLNAVSASFAATASSADNFVVRQSLTASSALINDTITAQTLLVQTVSSSVVYSSGSNVFGNQLTNTQQFTGSVSVTGSLSLNGTPLPTGTGANGQVTYWTSANTQTGSNNLFWDNGNGRLGIGTTSPSTRLDIRGSGAQTATIGSNDSGNVGVQLLTNVNNGIITLGNVLGTNPNFAIYTNNTTPLTLGTNNTAYIRLFSNGNFGINQLSDGGFRLDVQGTARVTGNTQVTGSFTVSSGSSVEFDVQQTGVRIGSIITDAHSVTGSLTISGSLNAPTITGSLFGTASWAQNAVSASRATTASLALTASSADSFLVRQSLTASAALISGSGTQRVTVVGSGSAQPLFTVLGSQGELFSIVDSLSGSLFSVNDISGLPIMEVFSDSTTLMGNYSAPMLITTFRTGSVAVGANTIYTLPTASYDGVFIDYTIKSGSNARAGNFSAIWTGTAVNFMDNSTVDFGNTTGFVFGAHVSGSNMIVTGSATTTGWTVKTIIRAI